jgi:3-dehydroquinate synthetase
MPLARLPDEDAFVTALNDRVTVDRLMHSMTFDKKAADGRMRLVLPRGIGAADVVDDVPLDLVREAWLHIGAAK